MNLGLLYCPQCTVAKVKVTLVPKYWLDATPRKIKNFSGNSKPGPGETDYRHWRRAAQRILDDRDLSRNRKQTILLQSLTGTAEDCIDLMAKRCP